ncbi:SDR family NAD(P)-dependent oxidoreductase [Paenibacillus phoenicis]|uniref:SDR family NAD(P)-dependent oxidoreductase n=1 Tax=Paenibacillus phoenicis TaxID=554117 RepID=A0ABU5PKG6_9BACL|nr:SDR family NAD(P)-dependent oxidoreductase [Paenibacillus phoenicis]MEA3570434.1 SDR family NAD(P)-dependent oxidoreductase [Paenibacillus phoenicis]
MAMRYTALVTGADYGIGLELVRKLLEEGHQVFAGRFNHKEQALPELASAYGEQLTLVDLDVGSDASVQAAAAKVKEHTESLDLLINNAAILGDIETTVLGELNFEEMLQVYNVNALGSLRMTNALIGLILNSNGRTIANISSEAGSVGQCYRDRWFAYTMSKAAVNMHSNVVHNGIKAQGGQVLVLHPGWVQTFMRGEKDAAAPLTPEQSAGKLWGIIREAMEREDKPLEKPVFLDVDGHVLPW